MARGGSVRTASNQNHASRIKSEGPISLNRNFNEKVKEIGRKTRLKLEEEVKKRKEIIRLDDVMKLDNPRERSSFSKSIFQSSCDVAVPKKRKRKSSSKPNPNFSLVTNHHPGKFPNLNQSETSFFVRLHGLPKGVITDNIYKFFVGLRPSGVFILPDCHVFIPNFDIELNLDLGLTIKRFPETFRIYVKFPSSLVATTALGRGGETIYCGEHFASVSLSPVSKSCARVLEIIMVPCRRRTSIEEVTSGLEKGLSTVINEILWVMTTRSLHLKYDVESVGGGRFPSIKMKEFNLIITLKNNNRKCLASLYNRLLKLQESIECKIGILRCIEDDPILVSLNPCNRLTLIASNWILDQMERIQQCLYAL